jgi:hypothetical protein
MKTIAKVLAFFVLLLIAIAFTGPAANSLYAIVFGLIAIIGFCVLLGLFSSIIIGGIVLAYKMLAAFFNFLFTGEWDIE